MFGKCAVAYVSHGCTRVFRCSEGRLVHHCHLNKLIRYFVYYLDLIVKVIIASA